MKDYEDMDLEEILREGNPEYRSWDDKTRTSQKNKQPIETYTPKTAGGKFLHLVGAIILYFIFWSLVAFILGSGHGQLDRY
jgi:hypothetical protein